MGHHRPLRSTGHRPLLSVSWEGWDLCFSHFKARGQCLHWITGPLGGGEFVLCVADWSVQAEKEGVPSTSSFPLNSGPGSPERKGPRLLYLQKHAARCPLHSGRSTTEAGSRGAAERGTRKGGRPREVWQVPRLCPADPHAPCLAGLAHGGPGSGRAGGYRAKPYQRPRGSERGPGAPFVSAPGYHGNGVLAPGRRGRFRALHPTGRPFLSLRARGCVRRTCVRCPRAGLAAAVSAGRAGAGQAVRGSWAEEGRQRLGRILLSI